MTAAGGEGALDLTVPAPSYADNRIGEPTTRRALILLPPGYDASPDRTYPVVYLLHGFGHNAARHRFWLGRGYAPDLHVVRIARALQEEREPLQMILVCPDGGNAYGGSMWEDSPVSGGAATFVARDLVDFVDRNFRTDARAARRGIAGHSMGGQGAVKIAMTHPGVFGAVYSLSGMMAISPDELLRYGRHWLLTEAEGERRAHADLDEMSSAYLAMCAAFCGSPGATPHGVDFPVVRARAGFDLHPHHAARFFAAWPQPCVERLGGGLRALGALRLDVGIRDSFHWGIESNRLFIRTLQEAGIPFSYEEYSGTHTSGLAERLRSCVLPFFSRYFSRPAPGGRPHAALERTR
jgi:enterochelin esterase-like enzyme